MDVAGGEGNRLWTAAKIALVVGGLGLLLSRFFVIRWASAQTPAVLLLVWYGVLFAITQVVFPLVLGNEGIWDPHHAQVGLGFVLVWFAIGIVAYFPASTYSVLVSGANPAAIPPYLISSEDQVTYQAWNGVLGPLGTVSTNLLIGLAIAAVAVVVVALKLTDRIQEEGVYEGAAVALVAAVVVAVVPWHLPPESGLWVLGLLTYALTPFVLTFLGVLLMRPEDVQKAVGAFD